MTSYKLSLSSRDSERGHVVRTAGFSRQLSDKALNWNELLSRRRVCSAKGLIVVFTNGCFDLLHVGHVRCLKAARHLGDVLIVGVNSDASVRRQKGPDRPVRPAGERLEILAALECVDYVLPFDEDTPEAVIAALQPDVCCKGSDYAPPHGKPLPESAVVMSYGGRFEFIPLVPHTSTSLLLDSIQNHRREHE